MPIAAYPFVIVNSSLPLLVGLSPNPNSISIERKKVFSKNQALQGWVYEHWGEEPQIMKVKGRTLPKLGNLNEQNGVPTEQSEWGVEASLLALEQLFHLDKRNLILTLPQLAEQSVINAIIPGEISQQTLNAPSSTYIFYRNNAYTGFFTDFKWSQDAEKNARYYEYEFTYLITQTLQDYIVDTVLSSSIGSLIASFGGVALSVSQGIPLIEKTIKSFSLTV